MKRIIFLFSLFFLVFSLNAQDKAISSLGGVAGVTNAVAAKKTAAYSFIYRVDAAPYYYTYQVHLDDESKTPTNQATLVVAGSLDNVNYKTIATVVYKSNGADTTIIGNLTSSPVTYKFIRYTITPNDTIWVKSMHLSAYPVK